MLWAIYSRKMWTLCHHQIWFADILGLFSCPPYTLSYFPHFYHRCPIYTQALPILTKTPPTSLNLTQPHSASTNLTWPHSTLQISHNLTYLKFSKLEACRHEKRPKCTRTSFNDTKCTHFSKVWRSRYEPQRQLFIVILWTNLIFG